MASYFSEEALLVAPFNSLATRLPCNRLQLLNQLYTVIAQPPRAGCTDMVGVPF